MRYAAVTLIVVILFSAACTTHEKKFEENVAPPASTRAADSVRSEQAATDLIQLYQRKMISLPPEALAPLAQAAALLFETTGAPGMQDAARGFANTLLGARVKLGSSEAFYGSKSLGQPDVQTTMDAGNALIDVFRITRDQRYLSAARSAARAVTSRRLGWIRRKQDFAVRAANVRGLYSIVLTAEAGAFLGRAATIGATPGARDQAAGAFRFVDAHQAAVGRWYLNVGSKTPMTLVTWARTLLALASTRSPFHQGILGGGGPALWAAAFTSSGRPRRTSLVDTEGVGVALSLRLFQRFAGTSNDADLAYGKILADRRPDGTLRNAPPNESIPQAFYALACAERALALRRPDEWDRRLIALSGLR
jgi:hypothetical protein